MDNAATALENHAHPPASRNSTHHLMGKIIFIVSVAIVVFLGFIAYSLHTSAHNSQQLSAIKDLYFPVLERVDANIVRLDKIEERMMQAVMTAEKDELETARALSTEAEVAFSDIQQLYPTRSDDINALKSAFSAYVELAHETSIALMENNGDNNAKLTALMNSQLSELRQRIHQFRQDSYGNFVNTLDQSEHAAEVNLYMSIAVGVMNLLFMAVLVYFIRNNMQMMTVIAEQNATLEQRVADRTAELSQKTHDINAMLDNMHLGVCTVVPGNRLHHEYSAHLNVIFGNQHFADQDIMASLFQHAQLGVDAKNQIETALDTILGEDAMMFHFNSHLLPNEMTIAVPHDTLSGLPGADQQQCLRLDWNPIINDDDTVEKVLLIVQDVTELRVLEQASAQQRQELDMIAQILHTPVVKFDDFIASALVFVLESRALIKRRNPDLVIELFRNMHTLKGNARSINFTVITDVTHIAEETYDQLRKQPEMAWDFQQLQSELDDVKAAINRYIHINEEVLGRKKGLTEQTNNGLFISDQDMAALKANVDLIANNADGDHIQRLQNQVRQLGLTPIHQIINHSLEALPSIANELEKPTPSVMVSNCDAAFEKPFASALQNALMHILRNAMDHGIEAPEQRQLANKAMRGIISFACNTVDAQRRLYISDDGRGLPLHKLYEKGLQAKLIAASDQPDADAVAALIFHSGLSTAEQITQLSGRGVGMDAVRAFLQNAGSNIHIELLNKPEIMGFTPFRFVIDLPND